MRAVVKHSHTELGRRSNCLACRQLKPDLENENAPPGCSYEFRSVGFEEIYVCRRHGFVSKVSGIDLVAPGLKDWGDLVEKTREFYQTYTDPCLARKSDDPPEN